VSSYAPVIDVGTVSKVCELAEACEEIKLRFPPPTFDCAHGSNAA
jgi:hypothetical protein